MRKRILSFLLILALLLPATTAFAASIGNVEERAISGQVLTLTTNAFTDQLQFDSEDADETLVSISFPTLPAANSALIRLDDTPLTADTAVPVADITAGDLTVEVTAAHGNTVTIPFVARLSDDAELTANLVIPVAAEVEDFHYTLEVGETVRVELGIVGGTQTGNRYLFALQGQENLTHGTLSPVTGELGVFVYHAQTEGVDTFTYTVTVNGIVSEPATVTITVIPSSVLPFLQYYDMPTHWAGFSAGRLAILEKIIGQQADNRFYFYPDKGITRGDFVIWLMAVMGIEPLEHTNTIYADEDIPSWLRGFLNAATEEGIIQGEPTESSETTSYFRPNNAITRIEAIRMVSIALGPEGHDDSLDGLFADIADIPGWAKNNVRHLYELDIINGDEDGYLNPGRNLSRGEAAELLYRAYKELVKVSDETPDQTPDETPEVS